MTIRPMPDHLRPTVFLSASGDMKDIARTSRRDLTEKLRSKGCDWEIFWWEKYHDHYQAQDTQSWQNLLLRRGQPARTIDHRSAG